VNAAVQSPLVRTLNNIPAKANNFTHGIADNVPPVSFDRLETKQYQGPTWSAYNPLVGGEVSRFRIAELGYLNRMYLRVRVACTLHDALSLTGGTLTPIARGTSLIDEVTITTHNKQIERLYGDTILSWASRQPDFPVLARGLKGFFVGCSTSPSAAGTAANVPCEPVPDDLLPNSAAESFVPHAVNLDATNTHAAIEYYIPLPFSAMVTPAQNFQTRFVEDLEVHVRWSNAGRNITDETADFAIGDVTLVSTYHNFHNNIENSIRNTNYQRGTPASQLGTDWIRNSSYTPIPQGTSGLTVELKSNNLAKGVLLVFSLKDGYYESVGGKPPTFDGPTATASSTFTPPRLEFGLEFRGSGRTLWKTTMLENRLMDSKRYYLNTMNPEGGTDCPYMEIMRDEWGDQAVGLVYLPFGFSANPQIQSGAVALQTLSNPEIIVTKGPAVGPAVYVTSYVQMHDMWRIDSDTGVVVRTLDV